MHAPEQVVAEGCGEPGLDLRHSFTEDEASHLIAQLLYLFRVGRCSKAFRQSEKSFLFFLLCFQTLLDQFDQHAIVAKASLSGNTLYLLGQPRGQGYASSKLFGGCHRTVIHRYGALCRTALTHPIQKLIPRSRKRKKPRPAVVQA